MFLVTVCGSKILVENATIACRFISRVGKSGHILNVIGSSAGWVISCGEDGFWVADAKEEYATTARTLWNGNHPDHMIHRDDCLLRPDYYFVEPTFRNAILTAVIEAWLEVLHSETMLVTA